VQPTTLVVGQQNSFLAMNLFEDLVLSKQVADDLLRLPIDPASENYEMKFPRLKNEIHMRSMMVKRVEGTLTIG